jgi:hypothetical protein
MVTEEFNEKYKDYIVEGFTGLQLHYPKAPVIERRIVRIGELNDEIKIRINPVRKVRI